MESINNVIKLIKPNVYMASIDLKDAFFSVPIHNDHQKYLKFIFGNLFQFTSMPNGYGPAMRIFTKISKVPFGHLRSQGHNSVIFVDDSYLQGDRYQSCLANILDTIKLLRELDFVIHSDKSVLTPSQTIAFLVFVISSKHVTLSLTDEKKNKIKTLLMNCLHSHQISIRELARILGNIVASFPAVTFGPLHYRHLERDKIRGLNITKVILKEKLVYLRKQYLRYTGGLITLTIHATILTTSRILTLPYTQILALQVDELPVEYPHLEVSGIRQN